MTAKTLEERMSYLEGRIDILVRLNISVVIAVATLVGSIIVVHVI